MFEVYVPVKVPDEGEQHWRYQCCRFIRAIDEAGAQLIATHRVTHQYRQEVFPGVVFIVIPYEFDTK